ncbi:MAG: DUF3365 domain-containing protein [Nitrospirota bacterium]|nr:DUF3365 domain-containing protein [Nitrospirota bacterium]
MGPKATLVSFKIIVAVLAMTITMIGGKALADSNQREQAAAKVTGAFLQELGAAMKREMGKGGPVEAIKVCRELAPEIANRLSRENGWRVTRVGTRVRNPLLGMPDAWEQKVLGNFSTRAAKGEAFSEMAFSEVVSEPAGRYFRFMKPIVVQPKCLLCHGSNETIPESIQKVLMKHYPFDAAKEYKAGDLRGAVSIKQPLGEFVD